MLSEAVGETGPSRSPRTKLSLRTLWPVWSAKGFIQTAEHRTTPLSTLQFVQIVNEAAESAAAVRRSAEYSPRGELLLRWKGCTSGVQPCSRTRSYHLDATYGTGARRARSR